MVKFIYFGHLIFVVICVNAEKGKEKTLAEIEEEFLKMYGKHGKLEIPSLDLLDNEDTLEEILAEDEGGETDNLLTLREKTMKLAEDFASLTQKTMEMIKKVGLAPPKNGEEEFSSEGDGTNDKCKISSETSEAEDNSTKQARKVANEVEGQCSSGDESSGKCQSAPQAPNLKGEL